MPFKLRIALAGLLVLWCAPTRAQLLGGENPVTWTARPPAAAPVAPGGLVEVTVDATIDGNWHLYSVTQPPGGPNATRFTVAPGSPFALAGPVKQPAPEVELDPNFGIQTEFFTVAAEFRVPLAARLDTPPGNHTVRIQVVFQVCNDRLCLPPKQVDIAVALRVGPGGAGAPPGRSGAGIPTPASAGRPAPPAGSAGPQQQGMGGARAGAQPAPATEEQTTGPAAQPPASPATAQRGPSAAVAGTAADVARARASGFLPYLWLALSMGALSLATPCVFPMIPITVSYFTKGSAAGKGAAVRQALVYSIGIVATFTGLGLGLAALLGATGINQFAANPWLNLAITGIFLGFALNLFGLYQIGVPSSVLTRLSKAGDHAGYGPTLIMGLTFTLTSFTCTVPFVGTVLVATAQGDWLWPAAGMLAFSIVFAAPFFVLALVPQLVASLPKSGGWLNSVKVTMGFLEVAAAMKFLSNADLVWNWNFFTREVVLAVWLAVAVLATAYLLGKFRLPHDSPIESLGVLRMVSAMLFLAIGFYLFIGLIGGSLGELDAFLPPREAGGFALTGAGASGREMTWHMSLRPALEQARREGKPIFIDFTGYTCTNCRWMEANIFPLPAVHAELARYARVQLYTDGVGREYEENQRYQREQFGTVALPLYVILDSQGKTVATYPGMTRKAEEFLLFLRGADGRTARLERAPTVGPLPQ